MCIGRLIFAELVQATTRVDAQLLTVAGSGSLCEPRTARTHSSQDKRSFHLVQPLAAVTSSEEGIVVRLASHLQLNTG